MFQTQVVWTVNHILLPEQTVIFVWPFVASQIQ
jgi:hypothetical protein